MFVDLDALQANGGDELDYGIYVSGDAAITGVAAAYAAADVLDKDAFLDVVSSEIDTMLGMFYALLMLAVAIALPRHRQHPGAVDLRADPRARTAPGRRHGSVAGPFHDPLGVDLIAVFGTTLRFAIGAFFGWVAVRAMADEGIDTLTVPVPTRA